MESKLKKIAQMEKELKREMKEKSEFKQMSRLQKLEKVQHNFSSKEKQYEQDRDHYNEERVKKIEEDREKERIWAQTNK